MIDKSKLPEHISQGDSVSFGRTCIKGTGIPTEIVAERFCAGESGVELVMDYRDNMKGFPAYMRFDFIEAAIRYEFNKLAESDNDDR